MKTILASLAVALSLTACNVAGTSSIVPGSAGAARETQDLLGGAPAAHIHVALYDAPLNGLPGVKVNVALAGVQLLNSAGAVPFVSYPQPKIVNLIDLQNNALNFDGNAPAGQYSGVRLLIASAQSNVSIGNMTIPIVWGSPGHPTTSPVVAVDFSVAFAASALPGVEAPTITLDFNVMQSV